MYLRKCLIVLHLHLKFSIRKPSTRDLRFDSTVTGRLENFESPRLPRLPSYHKQHSLFNDKFQSFQHCYCYSEEQSHKLPTPGGGKQQKGTIGILGVGQLSQVPSHLSWEHIWYMTSAPTLRLASTRPVSNDVRHTNEWRFEAVRGPYQGYGQQLS